MKCRFDLLTRALAGALVAGTLMACSRDAGSLGPVLGGHGEHAAFARNPAAETSPEVQKWLAGLRAATARFHRFEAARQAGYDARITPCMEQPGAGGMGYHYAHPLLIDAVVQEFAPEALLFEPQKNGNMRFVGVEYIVPFTAWTQPAPPVLHGLTFQANQEFQVWALHVWVGEHNPAGIFMNWNPRVHCGFAQD